MLDLNYTAPSLYILASIDRGSSFYEVQPYWERALKELNLIAKEGEEALISYSSYYVRQISNDQNVRENVKFLCDLCIAKDYASEIYDFYNLHFTWMDFEYDPNYPYNHYWEGATSKNIKQICIDQSVLWLEKYKKQFEQNTTNSAYAPAQDPTSKQQ